MLALIVHIFIFVQLSIPSERKWGLELMKIPVGVSACVIGQKVRFDGGHKRASFIENTLSEIFELQAICPEVGSGMSIPRPIIRQVQTTEGIRILGSKDSNLDVTDKLQSYADSLIPSITQLCGYLVCAKSPTCGMERVKVYNPEGTGCTKSGTGIFTGKLMSEMPWLPVEEDGRLCNTLICENFISRVYALHDLYQNVKTPFTAKQFIDFHSRYKLMLMASSPQAYRELGQLLADIKEQDLDKLFIEYRQLFMDGLKMISSRKLHTNTLMHIQGYFKKKLNSDERQAFAELIHDYRKGEVPLMSPLTLIQHYLQKYPDEYLKQQAYLNPHPQHLKLRYSI